MSDNPKTWAEMTDAEKGALLLAYHEGKTIQAYFHPGVWQTLDYPSWYNHFEYRVKPEPKRETVTLEGFTWNNEWFFRERDARKSHRITFDVIDREPDCASIKMERIDE